MKNNFKYILIAVLTLLPFLSVAQVEPVSVEGTPWDFIFKRDFIPGSTDSAGKVMHATNVMELAIHKGKLFAGLSYEHDTIDNYRMAMIIVKDCADCPWKVDTIYGAPCYHDTCAVQYGRVGAIESIPFTTDKFGNHLDPPVNVLLAGEGRNPKTVGVWSRNDSSGIWYRQELDKNIYIPEIRRFVHHIDAVTGVHLVFALGSGTIYHGAYDPTSQEQIEWLGKADLSHLNNRCLSAAVSNGVLYAHFAIRNDLPEPLASEGGLFRRIDGPNPRWELVQIDEWLDPHDPRLTTRTGAMRGMTALPNDELIFSWKEPNYMIERLVPKDNYFQPILELDVYKYMAAVWGVNPHPHMIIGYNDMPEFVHPRTQERVNLIGLFAIHPSGEGNPLGNSSWFLVRHAGGTYSHGRIYDPDDPVLTADNGLRGCRTIVQSPFPEESLTTFYFAGFDELDFRADGDLAWIYKATLPSAVGIEETTGSLLPLNPIIYPNPAQEKLFILNLSEHFKGTVNIFNAIGQLVLSEQKAGSLFNLNTSQLASGIYFIQLRDVNRRIFTKKIIKE